ncbi:MAG: molecular chaperone [Pararobbsia sp.]
MKTLATLIAHAPRLRAVLPCLFGCLGAAHASANVVISTTRAIVELPAGETVIRLRNTSPAPALVQLWTDTGDVQSTPDTSDAPFELTPALFVLDAGKTQTVRLHYDGDPLPDHNERLYWLNMLDVPATENKEADPQTETGEDTDSEAQRAPDAASASTGQAAQDRTTADANTPAADAKAQSADPGRPGSDTRADIQAGAQPETPEPGATTENVLNFVLRTRIKLFLRPADAPGKALDAPQQLVWRIEQGPTPAQTELVGTNPTAFHVSCSQVRALGAANRVKPLGKHTFAPGESARFALSPEPADDTKSPPAGAAVQSKTASSIWNEAVCVAINDFGSFDTFRATVAQPDASPQGDASP